MSELTIILQRIDQDDPHAANELLPLVYKELRKLAAQKMAFTNCFHLELTRSLSVGSPPKPLLRS